MTKGEELQDMKIANLEKSVKLLKKKLAAMEKRIKQLESRPSRFVRIGYGEPLK